jgi:hypothetical protein
MIRDLRPSDLTRQLLPGRLSGHDMVCSREKLIADPHRLSLLDLARNCLGATPRRRALTLIEGMHLVAIAVLRSRQGARTWEFSHVYASVEALDECDALLEQCGAAVAADGAERLFLRVPDASPLEAVARRSGFYPSFTEWVYQPEQGLTQAQVQAMLRLRPRIEADLHPLFRLYNASVPSTVRSAYGLTLDQWRDAQEPALGPVDEYVWERDGALLGWLRLSRHGGAKGIRVTIDAMLHPDASAAAPLLCQEAVRLASGGHRPVWPGWVIADHQAALAGVLLEVGWRPQRSYSVLIKSVTRRVGEASMALVHA